MAETSGESTLIKVAMFCIAMSVLSTVLLHMYIGGQGDYDYDTINEYRSDLVDFSGGQLVNDNPWVLNGVYTPFTPGSIPDEEIPNHIENDQGRSIGWLYGEKIDDYPYLNETANIKLDPNKKSNQLLTVGSGIDYTYASGKEWWAGGNDWGIDLSAGGKFLIALSGNEPGDDYGVIYSRGTGNNWNYSGYRYTFDPVLPFKSDAASKDGRLSLVWYQLADDTGLSGALEVYGNKDHDLIKLGSISAKDIITTFLSASGYIQVFDFDFKGTHLNLTIRFDPTVYNSYATLQQAWNDGAWSLAISSASAGNFFDVENSNAFAATAGSAVDTFIQIYTFDYPHFENNAWLEWIVWMLIGLPMTMGLLFITIRMVGGVFKIF